MPTKHRRQSNVSQAIGWALTVLCVVIAIAGLLSVTILAVKALWWVLTC